MGNILEDLLQLVFQNLLLEIIFKIQKLFCFLCQKIKNFKFLNHNLQKLFLCHNQT